MPGLGKRQSSRIVWLGKAVHHPGLVDAVPGTEYDILIEAYAGHGKLVVDGGPLPFGTNPDA